MYEFAGNDYPISTIESVTFGIVDSAANQICLNEGHHKVKIPLISPAEKLEDKWCQIQKVWFSSGYRSFKDLKKFNPPISH